MRILRLLKSGSKVPLVWFQLQKLHRSLKNEGVQASLRRDWRTGITGFSMAQIVKIHRVAWLFSPWTTCLRRSILLAADLRSNGFAADWKQGIRKGEKNQVQMHAWVEIEGKIVGDDPEFVRSFQPIELPLQ